MALLDYYNDIPVGKENAVTKWRLAAKWGVSERAVRKIIQELRIVDFEDDYVILSFSSGRGYYKSDDLEEIQAFKKEVTNRAKHTFLPLRKVNRILNRDPGNNLQQIRKERGLTTGEVVEFMQKYEPDFDKYILSKMENGKCGPTGRQLSLLADLYETTPEELTGLTLV